MSALELAQAAERLCGELKAFGLPVCTMPEHYLDLTHLLLAVEEGHEGYTKSPENHSFESLTNNGLLPLLVGEKGAISLIGISTHQPNGELQDASAIYTAIETYFSFAGINWDDPPRCFMVIPENLFEQIVKQKLLSNHEQRVKFLIGISDDMKSVEIFRTVVIKAIDEGASDIHIEFDPNLEPPDTWQTRLSGHSGKANAGRIRFRLDGRLETLEYILPWELLTHLVRTIKCMAGMETDELEVRDGKISFNDVTFSEYPQLDSYQEKLAGYELRVAALPLSSGGEDVTLRILKSRGEIVKLKKLISQPVVLADFSKLIEEPQGLIIISGPTGSGKTTTLYGALAQVNTPERKLLTVEDPVEIVLPGAVQAGVRNGIGLTFEVYARAFLRHDPDVILVGETRDEETAKIAIEAALTGHLVFTTLHAEGCIEAIDRMENLKVNLRDMAHVLLAVMSQRLVRAVCPKCSKPVRGNELLQELIGDQALSLDWPIYFLEANPSGCKNCQECGYLKRFMLAELLDLSSGISLLAPKEEELDINRLRQQAEEQGFRPLAVNAISAVSCGRTTMEEIRSVITSKQIRRNGRLIMQMLQEDRDKITSFQEEHFFGRTPSRH